MVNGNNTLLFTGLLGTASQILCTVGGISTLTALNPSAKKPAFIGVGSVSLSTNTNSNVDFDTWLTLNGTLIGSKMRDTISGIGHFATVGLTAFNDASFGGSPIYPPPSTNTLRLVVQPLTTSTLTATAVNLNGTIFN